MRTIKFTDSDVIFSEDNIININDFFYDMDTNIGGNEYYVRYDKEKNKYSLCYCYEKYNDIVLDHVEDKSIIKHLKNLAIAQKMIEEEADFSKVETDKDINDAKALYLSLVKKSNYTIGDYFSGISDDYSETKTVTGEDLINNHLGLYVLSVIVIFIAGVIYSTNYVPSEFLETSCVIVAALCLGTYPLYRFIKNYIKTRFNRIKAFKRKTTIKNYLIKDLEKSLEKAKELTKSPDFQISDNILQMIDNLTDLLAPIEPKTREELRIKLQKIFEDYLAIDEKNLSNADKFLQKSEIINRLGKLEGDINILKPSIGKKIAKKEIDHVRDRLYNLDATPQVEQKKYMKAL